MEKSNSNDKTVSVNRACQKLREDGVISGWRDELLPVIAKYGEVCPQFLIERAAYPWFGFKGYGVHINGYIRENRKDITHLWVAKRSLAKSTWPGMLDHIVAGGLPFGIGLFDNVVKECGEEANIHESLARTSICTGAVSYTQLDEQFQLKRDTLFCFDLELPQNFIPTPVDGEVEKFELQPIDWVIDKVIEGGSEGYKPNCNLVIIDFLFRHGLVSPESSGYLDVLRELRGEECC